MSSQQSEIVQAALPIRFIYGPDVACIAFKGILRTSSNQGFIKEPDMGACILPPPTPEESLVDSPSCFRVFVCLYFCIFHIFRSVFLCFHGFFAQGFVRLLPSWPTKPCAHWTLVISSRRVDESSFQCHVLYH